LNRQAVLPDKYDLMAVGPSKAPFESETINEFAQYIANELGKLQEYKDVVTAKADHTRKSLYRAKVAFLKPHVATSSSAKIKSEMLVLEYMVTIGSIFNETFLKPRAKVTRENIKDLRQEMVTQLQFFKEWHQSMASEIKEDEMIFLSLITYSNLRTGIFGFLWYCEYILFKEGGPAYVPFAHSNTSFLELLFSQMRGLNNDTPDTYQSGLGAIGFAHGINALKYNKMYDREQVGDLQNRDVIKDLTCRRNKERQLRVQSWTKQLVASDSINNTCTTQYFPTAFRTKKPQTNRLLSAMRNVAKGKPILHELVLEDEGFREYITANTFGSLEGWFRTLCQLSGTDKVLFEVACTQIIADIFRIWENSMYAPRTTIGSSYHYGVLRFLQDRQKDLRLKNRISGMPVSLRARGGNVILVLTFSRWFTGWIRKAMLQISKELNPATNVDNGGSSSPDDDKREVNRFLGWAVFDLRRKLVIRRDRAHNNKWRMAEDVPSMITHLDTMRIFHNEAVQDETYMRDCYSDSDLCNNDGWLTLVHKTYFSFGKELMGAIRREINVQKIERHGNAAVLQAITKIHEGADFAALKSKFMEASSTLLLATETKVSILLKLMKKTFHARAKAATIAYRAKKTDRHAPGAATQAFRQDLKAKTEKNTKAAAIRILGVGDDNPSGKKKRKKG
jgi:hypothetical protein